MTTPATPSTPPPAGDDRNLVPTGPVDVDSFEAQLNAFWAKNRTLVLAVLAVVVAVLVGKGIVDQMARSKELKVQQAFAAATKPEEFKSFAAAHPGHPLAGVAQLRIADEAYLAGKSAEAQAAYDLAISALKEGPLAARAQLGRALAKAQGGKAAEASAELKQLAGDANQFNAIRAEAAYHLASLAAEAGDGAEVQKYSEQLMQIDPTSPWTQRAMMLRAAMPVTAPTPSPAAPSPAPTAPKKDDASPEVRITLPGGK